MLIPSTYYHIYNHANGDENLFREQRNYPFFLEKYHHYIDPIAETIAWCLMPNHFHLLVRIKDEESLYLTFPKFQTLEKLNKNETLENLKHKEEKDLQLSYLLSKQFANVFSSYTQSFNKVYQRKGSLFLKNFKRKEIEHNVYLTQLILYIHLNPVKHGFTNHLAEWEWSSYQGFYQDHPSLARELFGQQEAYEKTHAEKCSYFKEYLQIETQMINA